MNSYFNNKDSEFAMVNNCTPLSFPIAFCLVALKFLIFSPSFSAASPTWNIVPKL